MGLTLGVGYVYCYSIYFLFVVAMLKKEDLKLGTQVRVKDGFYQGLVGAIVEQHVSRYIGEERAEPEDISLNIWVTNMSPITPLPKKYWETVEVTLDQVELVSTPSSGQVLEQLNEGDKEE